ncbi:type II secretion system protein [Alkalimonas sp.]|uniref:type II secretion system protein n=1 Tax=Alkalimonas sp. TaxID=1872453 RepID=UPI00263BAAB9|nr:type II secretion system protein [Alkalimonas sp.]MCC5824606.1 type II secretion system protein [Alkalimonas sp.]
MMQRGFTLIELLIVMVIGAVMLSLVGPVTISQYERTQRLKEREQLYRLIEHVEFEALLARSSRQLSFEQHKVVLAAGDQSTEWVFEHLQFEPQSLLVNGNGFWQQQALYWTEQEQHWVLELNPAAVQFETLVSRPAGQRLPAGHREQP